MKTRFGITSYYDPYGDMKSSRRKYKTENFTSNKSLDEVREIIKERNSTADYYSEVTVAPMDRRRRSFQDFDNHYYSKSKALKSEYQHIPGY